MTHDVFISYSTKDKTLANKICAYLESKKNITCWIAHRDIVPGADWPESIVNAITGARVMVLVFTQNANESAQMARELARADKQFLPVIALRTGEKVSPGKMLAYFLSTSHWMDIFPPPLEQHLNHLGEVIKNLLANQPPPQPRVPQKVDRRGLVAGAAAGFAALSAGAWWFYSRKRPSVGHTIAGTPNTGERTITVLPFKNLSNDSTQEYFSDGQTDAITTALAQLPGLTLVAPQSAFLLGKHNANLRTIDELLHVNYVIDGTVNRADKQVRVAARLIEVASSRIAWASSFNRQVTNVMSLQDDVARLIAASVQETLKLPGAARARTPVPALSNEAGTELLQAKAQLRQRARAEPGGPLTTAGELLESVVQRAPTYFPAQALLVQVYGFIVAYHALFSIDDVAKQSAFNDQWLSKAENAAVKATALAPDNPIAIAAMGLSQNLRGNVIAAEECYRRAYGMAAANTDIIHLYSLLLLNAGYIGQAGAMRKKLQELEPLVPVYAAFNVTSAWVSGDAQRAQKLLESSMIPIPAEHPFSARQHGLIYASQGKFREASNAVLRAAKTYDTQMVRAASELLLAAGTGSAYSAPDLGFFSILNVYSGKPERALEYFETSLKAGFWQAAEPAQFWHPSKEFAALRRTARFRKMVQGTQLAGLWQTRGKPDLCKIANPEDFCGR